MRIDLILRLLLAFALASSLPVLAMSTFSETKTQYQPSDSWLLARDGKVLQQVRMDFQVRRLQWTALEDISPALQQALVYSEDKRFFAHSGVDWQAVAAASWRNLWNSKTRGASTLTMQLAGLLEQDALHGRRNLVQKLGQAKDAIVLDAQWQKAEILEAYLNLVPFRGELQGVAAMSFGLFDKAPKSLDAREAAVAAVLLRAPNAKPAKVAERACVLLRQMQRPQMCDGLEGFAALKLQGPFALKTADFAPHLARKLLTNPGERVASSLDLSLQRFAMQQLRANLMQLEARNVQDGAVLVLDNQTGQVLAWVGSSGTLSEAPEVDGVTAPRQAGSTLKPLLYATAIEKKSLTAASILDDSPVRITTPSGYYIPQNYDKHFVGLVSLRTALGSSLNVPAVRTLLRISPDDFYERLQNLGFATLNQSVDDYGYSLALGAADVRLVDLTNAYRALANQGLASPISSENTLRKASYTQVFTPQTAYIINDILADNNARFHTFGLDSALKTRYWTAVKTGTSKDMRDNWCVGFSSKYTVGVWVGNASGAPMHEVSGVHGAAPVWRGIMDYLHREVKSTPPRLPQGVEARKIYFTPQLEPPRRELFITGTGQNEIIANAQTQEDDKQSANHMVRIAYPGQGTIIALDPEIPLKQQRLVFKTTTSSSGKWQWWLNGQLIKSSASVCSWQPMPGRYALQLKEANGKLIDTVNFEVRGAVVTSSSQRLRREHTP